MLLNHLITDRGEKAEQTSWLSRLTSISLTPLPRFLHLFTWKALTELANLKFLLEHFIAHWDLMTDTQYMEEQLRKFNFLSNSPPSTELQRRARCLLVKETLLLRNYFPFLYVSMNHIYHTEITIWYFWKSFTAFPRNQSKSKEISILALITEATLPQFHTQYSTRKALIISVICRIPLWIISSEKYKPGWQEKQDGTSETAALNEALKLSIKLIILFLLQFWNNIGSYELWPLLLLLASN